MSKYTTELRYIVEAYAGEPASVGYNDVNDTIVRALPSLFNFDFPIFDEAYKTTLLTKIVKHYYTREIGEETVGLWKLRLDARMNEIMPYYNKLYASELLTINPLYTANYDKTHTDSGGDIRTVAETNTGTVTSKNEFESKSESTGKSTGKGTNAMSEDKSRGTTVQGEVNMVNAGSDTVSAESSNTNRYSDTPQGGLEGISSNKYLTNATLDNGTDETVTEYGKKENTKERQITTEKDVVQNGSEYQNEGNSEDKSSSDGTSNGKVTNDLARNVNDTITTTRAYVEHVVGNTAGKSESKLLEEYRQTFLNIDLKIIDELRDLFIMLW